MKIGAGIKEGFLQEMPPKPSFEERTGMSHGVYIRNSVLQSVRAVFVKTRREQSSRNYK